MPMENCSSFLKRRELLLKTEMGHMGLTPLEVAVIPRGIKFQVFVKSDEASGYICENFKAPFQLPERGPIGANGLANSRDFLTPVAQFEDETGEFLLGAKYQGDSGSAKSITALSMSSLGMAITHLTNTIYAISIQSTLSVMITWTLPFLPYSLLLLPESEQPIVTLSFSRHVGWWPKIRSDPPGTTAML